MSNPLHNLPLPPGQLIGMVATALLDRLQPAGLPGPRWAQRTAGSALMAAGWALTGWALAERRRHATDGFDLERPRMLVTTGPYRLSRHPMYVGWWLIHLGFGLLRGSAWVLVTVPAAVAGEHGGVVAEESKLVQLFGRQFLGYAERVPRYLPLANARRRAGVPGGLDGGARARPPAEIPSQGKTARWEALHWATGPSRSKSP